MKATIHVKGGKPLQGTVTIAPNKNAILPALLASILTDETMTYKNVPESPDVKKILAALAAMGAKVTAKNDQTVTICCKELFTSIVPSEHIREMQAGYLFAGPLLTRFGTACIPPSSGCQLGYRGYQDHAEYLKKLCVSIDLKDIGDQKYIYFSQTAESRECEIYSKERSPYENRRVSYNNPLVTPSENILMMLAGNSRFDTEVSGIAQEPHVVQLIELLKAMGAQIKGKGSTVKVRNSSKLKGATFIPEPDHVDYFGFVITAAMTRSDLSLRLPVTESILHINEFIKSTGIVIEPEKGGVKVLGSKSSYSPSPTFPRANDANTYKMNPGPWPMFPVDCLPSFIAWSTLNQDPSTSTFSNNWMYDNGIEYVPVMQQMGARIPSYDRQRVTTLGVAHPHPYRSSKLEVTAPNVIEGVRALISCALSGGEYVIHNAHYILRRNPNFFDVLKELGADITVL